MANAAALGACVLLATAILACTGQPTTRLTNGGARPGTLTDITERGRQRVWAIYVSATRRERARAEARGQGTDSDDLARPIPEDATKVLRSYGLSVEHLPAIIEEARLRQWGESAGCRFAGDQPIRQHPNVYPPSARHMPPPKYTEEACARRINGTAVVQLTVDRDGRSGDPQVLRGLPGGFSERAIEVVAATKWWPALLCGAPVPVHTTVAVKFELSACR